MAEKKLYRTQGKLAGVCAGLAEYLDTDVVIVRIIWLVFTFILTGIGPFAYIICAIVLPKKEDMDLTTPPKTPHCEEPQTSESTPSEKSSSRAHSKVEESKKAAETQGKDYDSGEYNKTATGYQK